MRAILNPTTIKNYQEKYKKSDINSKKSIFYMTKKRRKKLMFNEIQEQPKILKKLIEKYFLINKPVQNIKLNLLKEEIINLSKIYIIASGSSRNVGGIAKYFFENIAKIPVEVDYASEFSHRNPNLTTNDFVIAISQSGETADTFSALKVAKEKGSHTFALTNNPESKIHNLAESQMQAGAGEEKNIAATKSFTAQLINLYALALYLAEQRDIANAETRENLKQEFYSAIDKLEELINNTEEFDKIVQKIKDSKSLIILGRGSNFPVAQEGALKIKETSYIDANGYPSGEFLHGYVAVVDENIPVISIIIPNLVDDATYRLSIQNTETVKKKRNPSLIIIKSKKDKEIESNPEFKDAYFINIPDSCEMISPVFTSVALQILAFKVAETLGRDFSNPRGLTKAITSE